MNISHHFHNAKLRIDLCASAARMRLSFGVRILDATVSFWASRARIFDTCYFFIHTRLASQPVGGVATAPTSLPTVCYFRQPADLPNNDAFTKHMIRTKSYVEKMHARACHTELLCVMHRHRIYDMNTTQWSEMLIRSTPAVATAAVAVGSAVVVSFPRQQRVCIASNAIFFHKRIRRTLSYYYTFDMRAQTYDVFFVHPLSSDTQPPPKCVRACCENGLRTVGPW